jgi:hypothetical protein
MHLGGIMSSATKRFIADLAERAGKVFIYAYLASWVSRGVEYDTLFTQDNAEAGVVGLALSLAVSVGIARHVGSNDSASLLPANVDPPQ